MKTNAQAPVQPRRNRLLQEHIHDPYQTKGKPAEPAVCPVCQAVFHGGRWRWAESWPFDSQPETCPACHRTKDNYPAGVATLTGSFVRAHRAELINLARHHEQAENAEHPLNRIMAVAETADTIVIKTTDIHLPRRIGDALRHAYKGALETHYDEAGYFARVNWSR